MEHNWSGWPGAWCLNCGCDDLIELWLAEGNDPDDPIPPEYLNSEECPGPLDGHNPYVDK